MKKINLFIIALMAFLCIGVINVYALDTANIDSKLTDGKLILKSILPASISDFNSRNEAFYKVFYKTLGNDYSYRNCNDSFTSCTIIYNSENSIQEQKTVNLEYRFDESIKEKIDEYFTNLNGKKRFAVSDLEIINFWVNYSQDSTLLEFSEEFKSNFEYGNLIPTLDVRGGGGTDGMFDNSNIGFASLYYNDTLYRFEDGFGAYSRNIIYIPSDTAEEDVLDVAQARIDAYIGEGKAVLSAGNTVESYIEMSRFMDEQTGTTIYQDAIINENGALHFLVNPNISEYYYDVTINGNVENVHQVVIIKDSSKTEFLTYKTADLKSDIIISSSTSSIPLDTRINVSKITGGDKYDKIMTILDVTNSEMFDLSLFSKSINENITELEDGSFEVRIPISENYRGRDLIIYYVDENDNDKIYEYEVTIEGNYAVFNTNHFSVYTLVATSEPTPANPRTSDGIINSIIIASISFVGLFGASRYLNKKRFN